MKAILPESFTPQYGLRLYLPLALVLGLMLGQRILVRFIPDIGIPGIFLAGSLLGLVCGRRFNFWKVTQKAVEEAMPILVILAGVGMFIQVMTLTGARGWVVMTFLSMPSGFLYLAIAASLPLFGGISAYGASSIFGVPFMLTLISKNAILTSTALSAVAGLGDLVPPTALAGIFAAQVVEEDNYFRVLRHCLVPALMVLGAGIGILLLAPYLDKFI
jgi:TRAP-type C4-dicarboxylate transport system permease large subunit